MLFCSGSLIAATDPVATLATYASLKVDPVLNVMVFGVTSWKKVWGWETLDCFFWETMNDISWTDMVEDLYIYMYINISCIYTYMYMYIFYPLLRQGGCWDVDVLTPQFKISPRQTHKKNDTSDSAAQGIDDQRCCGHCGFRNHE